VSLTVKGRQYFIDGEKVPSVTELKDGGLPKHLEKWAAETTANYAVDHWDELGKMSISERLKLLNSSRFADRDKAAGKGTKVHKLAEQLVAGTEVAVPEELRGHVDACVQFLDSFNVQPIIVERPVFSRRWRYGGRPDLFADITHPTDPRYTGRWLLDWKTNRSGPWGDVAFQLAGYRYAEVYLDSHNQEQPVPEVDRCGVVWLRADGYDLHPFEVGPDVYREFLYIKAVAEAAARSRDYRHDAITPPSQEAA
jgi:hypothetical protein